MNKISRFLRRPLFLLLLALMVVSNSAAQGFEPRIVFASNRDGDWDIYSMDVNGDNVVQLTDHPATDRISRLLAGREKDCVLDPRVVLHVTLYVMDNRWQQRD